MAFFLELILLLQHILHQLLFFLVAICIIVRDSFFARMVIVYIFVAVDESICRKRWIKLLEQEDFDRQKAPRMWNGQKMAQFLPSSKVDQFKSQLSRVEKNGEKTAYRIPLERTDTSLLRASENFEKTVPMILSDHKHLSPSSMADQYRRPFPRLEENEEKNAPKISLKKKHISPLRNEKYLMIKEKRMNSMCGTKALEQKEEMKRKNSDFEVDGCLASKPLKACEDVNDIAAMKNLRLLEHSENTNLPSDISDDDIIDYDLMMRLRLAMDIEDITNRMKGLSLIEHSGRKTHPYMQNITNFMNVFRSPDIIIECASAINLDSLIRTRS